MHGQKKVSSFEVAFKEMRENLFTLFNVIWNIHLYFLALRPLLVGLWTLCATSPARCVAPPPPGSTLVPSPARGASHSTGATTSGRPPSWSARADTGAPLMRGAAPPAELAG